MANDTELKQLLQRLVKAVERVADALEGGGSVTTQGGGNGNGPPQPK